MREKTFDLILKEYFDINDRRTMKTLLSLNEAEQNQAMASLASKLYAKIVDRVDEIDFGTIPASAGDITKIGNYTEMVDCVSIIRDIMLHYKQDTKQIDTIDTAIQNMISSKKTWQKAFAVNSELPITFYNTICLSIVSSISLLISTSIDFISTPSSVKTFQISFDTVAYNKTKDKLLFQNLDKFNKAYDKGDVIKLMDTINKTTSNVRESALDIDEYIEEIAIESIVATISSAALIATLVTFVIPVLHILVNTLYCAKQSISEYFDAQSKIIQFNAEQLKYNYTKSEEEIKKIYDKQMKIAGTFKKISNALAVKLNKADKEARAITEKDKSEKLKVDDINIPATSTIF